MSQTKAYNNQYRNLLPFFVIDISHMELDNNEVVVFNHSTTNIQVIFCRKTT